MSTGTVAQSKLVVLAILLAGLTMLVERAECRSPVLALDRMAKSCGEALVDRVARICNGKYNAFQDGRRPGHRVVRRGITEDCCETACKDSYLQTHYCYEPEGYLELEEVGDSSHPQAEPSRPIQAGAAARYLYEAEQVAQEPARVAPAVPTTPKSRVTIGRVSPDFVKAWTYLRR